MKLNNLLLMSSDEVESFICSLIDISSPKTVGFLNQHGYNLMANDNDVYESFNGLDVLLRDGKGIELVCRYWGKDAGENLNGTDLIPQIVNKCLNSNKDFSYFVYGTASPWLELGTKNMFGENDVKVLDGFMDESQYISHFDSHHSVSKYKLVILAMGMPKQEKVARLIKATASGPTLIICGGAIIDFQANRFNRSPLIFRKLGFEWLYRLIIEPRRMFKRYVIGIPVFFSNVVKKKITF
ncbi:WecB/TagA/CpsF family glycosyltransferase [Vibrio sp. M260118]|uniref:WecB/TagA/CpsF family glycosyltransferase n=1 Tax=Vibrio sp. M260118 TaxID=3020896 RepID=UPI002F40FBD8